MAVQGKYADGTNYAKSIDPSASNIVDPGILGGKVRIHQDTATITAALNLRSSGYVIVGGKLPTGAQVVQIILGSTNVGLATSSIVRVGDEGDDDRYMTATTISANMVSIGPNVSTGMGYTVTGVTDNYIRVKGDINSSVVSSGVISVSILYLVE